MPVWHAKTKALRAAGDLAVVGIVQEQHRERAELYAQWQGLDWPILWDPFNLTGAEVVLNAYLVGPDGVIWKAGAKPEDLEEFLAADLGKTERLEDASLSEPRLTWQHDWDLEPRSHQFLGDDAPSDAGLMSQVLWFRPSPLTFDELMSVVPLMLADRGDLERPEHSFRRGVIARFLHDRDSSQELAKALAKGKDLEVPFTTPLFEYAANEWAEALAARPSQYIWRRRLQQYGPQLDKPYPFYDWVDEARAAITARGETPVKLRAALTPTETLGRAVAEVASTVEPDPDAKLPKDAASFALEMTFVADTQGRERVCLHLAFTPRAAKDTHWNDEAGPLVVWIEGTDGVVEAQRLERAPEPGADETDRRSISLDLTPKTGAQLRGYAVLQACTADVCQTVRHDFRLDLPTSKD